MQYQYRDVKVFLPPRKILFQQPDFLHIRPTVDLAQIQNQTKLTGDGFGKRERPPGPPQPQTGQQPENGDQADDFRITEIATLTFAAPIAWKNTGVIRENTAEKKLSPIMRGISRVDFERI